MNDEVNHSEFVAFQSKAGRTESDRKVNGNETSENSDEDYDAAASEMVSKLKRFHWKHQQLRG